MSAIIGPILKPINARGSCFADVLTMVKKISSAKDLELDQMQIRVKDFEGEYMCACVNNLCCFIALAFTNVHTV